MKRSPQRHFLTLLAGIVLLSSTTALARRQEPAPDSQSSGASRQEGAAQAESSTKAAPAKQKEEEPEHIFKTPDEWRKLLTAEQFMVTRLKATENAFSGNYAVGHFKGTFLCVCCGAKLFDARTKFDSGTGWPSFYRPVAAGSVDSAWDYSEPAEARVEVTCHRCGAHLGHVFQDGPPPTGLRYCINSLSLRLDAEKSSLTASTRKTTRRATSRTTRKGHASSGHTASKMTPKSSQTSEPKS